MDCGEFREFVHELALENVRGAKILGAATAVSARFHSQTCRPCAERLREAELLADALKITTEDAAQSGTLPKVEAALMNAFREHRRSLEQARIRQRRLRLSGAEWMAVAAATITLAFAGWRLLRPHTHGAQITQMDGSALHTNTAAPRRAVPVDTTRPDADFVPLPYGESFPDSDSAVVVRVSMTRSALASLGYPIAAGREDEVVRADLIVGEDGWPRAVRIVQ